MYEGTVSNAECDLRPRTTGQRTTGPRTTDKCGVGNTEWARSKERTRGRGDEGTLRMRIAGLDGDSETKEDPQAIFDCREG